MHPTDLLHYIDTPPDFEADIISRAKSQIGLTSSLEHVSSLLLSLSSHFSSIHSEMTQLTQALSSFNLNLPISGVLTSFAQMFDTWGRQFVSQSNMSLQIVRTVIFPNVDKLSQSYQTASQQFNKSLDSFASLDKKARYEEIANAEDSAIKSFTTRAGALYALTNSVKIAENTSSTAVTVALAQFICLTSNLMKKFLNEHKDLIDITEESVSGLQSSIKSSLSQNLDPPLENIASKTAESYIDMRLNTNAPMVNGLTHPCSIAWLGESHSFKATKWTRKFIVFNDGVLTAKDPMGIEKDMQWNLPLVTVMTIEKQRRFCFKIQSPQELIEIQALSSYDLSEWVSLFTNHNFKMIGQNETSKSHCCADCGAADATWISVNWAVHLCLKCSGVHRMLSSTNSKVRSITLDKIHPITLQMMEKIGPNYANELLLHKPHKEKIDLRTEDPLRQIYITRKYVNFEWRNRDEAPDPFVAIQNKDIKALFYAAHFGRIDDRDETLTPLHAACSLGDPHAVALLAFCSSDINCLDGNGWTPLCYAVYYQHIKIVEFLLHFGASPLLGTVSIRKMAIATKNIELAKIILLSAPQNSDQSILFSPITTKYAPSEFKENYRVIGK